MARASFWLVFLCCVLLPGWGWCQTPRVFPQLAQGAVVPAEDTFLFDNVGKSTQSLEKPIRRTLENRQTFIFALEVLEQDSTFPDLLLTLSVTNAEGNADIYCNTYRISNSIGPPSPSFSAWRSEHTQGQDHVFISRNQDLYVDEKKLNVTVNGEDFRSAKFVCTIVGKASGGTDVELDVDVSYKSRNLAKEEIRAIKQIHENCCGGVLPCPFGTNSSEVSVLTSSAFKDDNEDALYDFCHALGSFCDEDGRLVDLDMNGFNFECDFPIAAIGKLEKLRKLDMKSNNMSGDIEEIAEGLSELKHLERVNLLGNMLSGSLSKGKKSGVCQLASQLKYLSLSNNTIGGQVPECLFQANSTVEELLLDFNAFEGTLPEFSPDAKIEILSIRNSGLSGFIPDSLGSMSSIQKLRLPRNKLKGTIPDSIGLPPKLMVLDLGFNHFVGRVPDSVASAPLLQTFNAPANNLTTIPEAWVNGTPKSESLQHVELSMNQIEAGFPVGLGSLPNLVYINLSFNKFGGKLPSQENMFPAAKRLIFSHNSFEGELPEDFGSIGMFAVDFGIELFPGDYQFTLAENDLTGEIPQFLLDSSLPEGLRNRIFLGGNKLSCSEPRLVHGISDLVCFTKCDCSNKGESESRGNSNLLENEQGEKSENGVDSLSTGAQAAIGVLGAILVLVLVVIIGVVIKVVWRKKRWTTKLNDIASMERDIEVGARRAD